MTQKIPPSFSERHGLVPPDAEISIRDEAPDELRGIVIRFARDAGLSYDHLRSLLTRRTMTIPNSDNWSESNVAYEVRGLVAECSWNGIYDFAEDICDALGSKALGRGGFHPDPNAARAEQEAFSLPLNEYFRRRGFAWQLVNGLIQIRGGDAFEAIVGGAYASAIACRLSTVGEEIHEALRDLSRRPTPDRTGAVRHAMAALEATARHATAEKKKTLGEILKMYPDLFPAPLGLAVEKLWGYASDRVRHVTEGATVGPAEVELMVNVACAAASYLMQTLERGPEMGSRSVP